MAAQEDKKIRFEATGNLSDFMKKMQADGKAMYQQFAKEAASQTKNEKERYKIIKDQITALNEQLKIEQKITREKLSRAKSSYEKSTDPTTESFFKKRMEDQQAKLNQLTDQGRAGKAASAMNSAPVEKKESVFGAVLMAGLFRDLANLIKQTASARSEFDLIPGAASIAGTGMGAAAGLFMSPGTTAVGKEVGGFLGSAYQRSLLERERYYGSSNRVYGLTGAQSQAGNMSRFGIDRAAGAQLEESIVRAIGKGTTVEQIRNVAAIAKAFSIETSTVNSFLGTSRMGANVNEERIAGLMTQGIERTRLGEAVQSITSMMGAIEQHTRPDVTSAQQWITEGNNIGGAFSVGDPRSAGYMAQLHGNLANPQSAFAQAMSYKALRQQYPKLGVVDLLKKRQAGGAEYERAILEDIAGMSGSKDFATLAYSKNFGTGNLGVDELRLQSRGKIGVGGSQLVQMGSESGQYGMGTKELEQQAQKMTTSLQQSTTAVTNAFIDSFDAGIKELAIRFGDRMGEAIDKAFDMQWEKLKARYGWSGFGSVPPKNGR